MLSTIPQAAFRLERLFFSSVHSYYGRFAEGEALPRRTLHHHALCYVTEGKGQIILNGGLLTANKGDLFLLLPETSVEGKALTAEPLRYMIIFFSCIQLRKDHRHQELHPPVFPVNGKLKAPGHPRAAEISRQMTSFHRTRNPEDIMHAKYRLQRLLALLLQPSKRMVQGKAVGMDTVLAHMKNNYNQELKVGQLALMAGLSTNHFIRAFKQLTEKTPMAYLLEERIKGLSSCSSLPNVSSRSPRKWAIRTSIISAGCSKNRKAWHRPATSKTIISVLLFSTMVWMIT